MTAFCICYSLQKSFSFQDGKSLAQLVVKLLGNVLAKQQLILVNEKSVVVVAQEVERQTTGMDDSGSNPF